MPSYSQDCVASYVLLYKCVGFLFSYDPYIGQCITVLSHLNLNIYLSTFDKSSWEQVYL